MFDFSYYQSQSSIDSGLGRWTSRSLATFEDHLVAKLARPMFDEAIDARAHVSRLEQRRCDLVHQGVGSPNASLQICSNELLAGCEGEIRTTAESLGKGSSL